MAARSARRFPLRMARAINDVARPDEQTHAFATGTKRCRPHHACCCCGAKDTLFAIVFGEALSAHSALLCCCSCFPRFFARQQVLVGSCKPHAPGLRLAVLVFVCFFSARLTTRHDMNHERAQLEPKYSQLAPCTGGASSRAHLGQRAPRLRPLHPEVEHALSRE